MLKALPGVGSCNTMTGTFFDASCSPSSSIGPDRSTSFDPLSNLLITASVPVSSCVPVKDKPSGCVCEAFDERNVNTAAVNCKSLTNVEPRTGNALSSFQTLETEESKPLASSAIAATPAGAVKMAVTYVFANGNESPWPTTVMFGPVFT